MHDHLSETVAQVIGDAPGALHLVERRPIEHQSNRLYDVWVNGTHLIVKEYLKPEEFSTAPLHEYRALVLLESLDVAPRPVGVQLGHGQHGGPLLVYEYLDGEMWDRQKPTPSKLAALADLWLRLHAVPAAQLWDARGLASVTQRYGRFNESFQAFAAWTDSAYPDGRAAVMLCLDVLARRSNVAADLDALLAAQPARRYFCRSDARFANVIDRPDGRLGLVDWEDSGLRDPAREVSDLLYGANQEDLLSPDEWQAFLTPYLAALTPDDPTLPRRIHLYAALYPLFWLNLLLRVGIERARTGALATWTVNGLAPDTRLRRYLARALAWPDSDFSGQLETLEDVRFFPIAGASLPA